MIPSVVVPISRDEVLRAIGTREKKGNEIKRFEEKFSEYLGCKHAIATSSGTSSLFVLLKAYGINMGDEVILPAYMCEIIPRLLLDMGLKINFVDIDKETYNISIEDLNTKVSKNTKAIVAVHMFGNPCEMDEIFKIANDYGAVVIEDSAQCIGAEYRGRKTGTIGDAGFFSLNEGKPITTMGGGVIVTNDEQTAERARGVVENFKEISNLKKMELISRLLAYYPLKNPIYCNLLYRMIESRRNSRRGQLKKDNKLNIDFKYADKKASIGMVQLTKLDEFNHKRIKNVNFYLENLDLDNSQVPSSPNDSYPVFLRFPIWLKNISIRERDELIKKLRNAGIDAPVGYPNSLPKFFLDLGGFKNTEDIVKKTITLPTHPYMRENDLRKIASIIKNETG